MRRLAKREADLKGQIESADRALHNADFLARAPEEVVRQKRDHADELRAELTIIIQNLADLE